MILDLILKKIMGGNESKPLRCTSGSGGHGCLSLHNHIDKEEEYTRPTKLSKSAIKKLRKQRKEKPEFIWDEIPTPSVHEHRDTMSEPTVPTQERLMQIIKCFPYPSPRPTPVSTPIGTPNNSVGSPRGALSNAVGKLVQVSVETMAITALPMDVWLKERLKKWVQLSGHEGSIVPATPHTLYKKQASNCSEARAYEAISRDRALDGFTPKYYNELQKDEERFIEIEDLLQQFADPSKTAIMDIKVGTRTFLESEVSNTKKRADLYEKMIAIDPDEPTCEEKKCKEITKLRYMQFRERESSSAQLGFRIEAAKMPGGQLQKNFKKVRTRDDVATTMLSFFGRERERVRRELVDRLKKMRDAIENSEFFSRYEVVGSSLLIVYDGEKIGCWMIDFAKSSPVPDHRTLNHRTPWIPGNNEDGYLLGIDNLLQILEELPAYGIFPDEQEELEQYQPYNFVSEQMR